MGTHPIFESDFDCLTDKKLVKSKKKWSKGKSRDKLQNMCLFDKPTYDKVMKEVPNYEVITPSIVSDRMKIRGSLARRAIKELHQLGKIKLLVQHAAQMVYTRAIAVDDEEEEEQTQTKGKKKEKNKFSLLSS